MPGGLDRLGAIGLVVDASDMSVLDVSEGVGVCSCFEESSVSREGFAEPKEDRLWIQAELIRLENADWSCSGWDSCGFESIGSHSVSPFGEASVPLEQLGPYRVERHCATPSVEKVEKLWRKSG